MSIQFEDPNHIEAHRHGAKKLFGFAMREDSLALYNRIDRPAPSQLPILASRRIGADYVTAYHEESNSYNLLLNGLGDTQTFILNILDQHPNIPFEKAIEIGQHERTITALAVLARQRQFMSSVLLKSPGDSYDLSPDKQAIEMGDSFKPNRSQGCAAVKVVAGEAEPLPIFQRFAPWAAKLAIISYYDHK